LKIALTGDWGTGIWNDHGQPQCPSQAVLQQIQAASPDVVIHLGDVYYAGTQGFPYEEENNLVNLWPNFKYSFTLNSNHEMYDGGNGYFKVALPSKKFANNKSYFSIEFEDWLILGLDSAYYDPSLLYMDGALVDSNQIGFIKSFDLTGKKVMVLTHHNAITTDGQRKMGLWDNVVNALGRAPDYWYWGHIHNGIVYSPSSVAGSKTKVRCLGHGALPFGNGYALHDRSGNPIPQVLYYSHEPLPNPNHISQLDNRVLNGYAVLTLAADSITEIFYDQNGVSRFTQSEKFDQVRLPMPA
jgi:3',5'-cyclic AMP phosphodiesterase CpdA